MPSKCFVLGCRSNYCSEPKVRVFSFPRDEILKNQWLRAIQREDKRQPSKASKICALHFKAEDIITEASGFNSKTQEFITVPLQKHRLKPNAVPSVFNNLPRTRKKTWKKISRKTHDRTNIQHIEGSQECVPNSGPIFQFPKKPGFRDLWLKKIKRPLLKVNENIGVCIKHFEKHFIVDHKESKNEGVRKRLTIRPGAVPSIFHDPDIDSNSDDADVSTYKELEETNMSMQSRHSRSSSDVSKSDDSPTKKTQVSPTTDKPFITVIKPEDSRLGEPTSPEAVGEDSSSCSEVLNSSNKSSPTKTNPNSLPSPYKHFPSVSVCLKEEDRLNVQRELDKPVKRTASVSSNNSTGSNEVSKLQPKRRKIEKPAPTVIGRQNDCYCWVCHRENVTLLCIACPRAFHQKCAGDQVVSSNEPDWVCPECKRILTAENVDTRSSVLSEISLDKLCTLLRFSLNKMKHRAGVAFHQPVSLEHYPMYHHYVIHPMDFSLLEKNIKQKLYGCTEAFLADVKWILHNSCVFNGSQHPLSTNAKSLVKTCDNDMQEIEVCPDCFMHSIVRNKYWFSEVCRKPHPLVWAKLKGFPYWPAKVVRIADGNIDARFFGAHDRAWVPISQCYHLSKEMPTSSKPKKKGNYETALDELNVHVQLLIQKFGKFEYASYRTSFDPDNKFLAYHGIDIDKIDKEEISCDISTSESNDISLNGADNEASVKPVKDTEKYRNIQLDITLPKSNVSSQNDNSSETKNVNNPSTTVVNKDKNDTKLTDEADKPVSDSNQLKKIELVLQKIKGYISTADDEEDNEGKDAEPKENVTELKDNSAVDATINKTDSSPNVSKDDSKKEGNEDISFITGLIKSKTLPSIEIPSIEEDSVKEKTPILDVTKKNDSFSLKLIETIASCKAKLDEEEYEEEDEEDEDEEEHEVEDEEEHEVEDEEEHEVEDEEEHEVEDEEEHKVKGEEEHKVKDEEEHEVEDEEEHEVEDEEHEVTDEDHELEDKDHELEGKDHEMEGKEHEVEGKEHEVEDKEHEEGKDDYHLEQKSRKKIKIDTNLLEEEANEESTSEMEVEGNSNCSDTDIEMIDEVENSVTNYAEKESNNHPEDVSINDRKNYTECKESVDHKEINDLSDQNTSNVLLKSTAENKVFEKESIIEDDRKSGNLETESIEKQNENLNLKDELTGLDLQLNETFKIDVSEEVMENQQEKGTIPELEKKIVKETDYTIISLISDSKNSGVKLLKEQQMEDDDIFICNSPPEKPPTPPLICLDDGNETDESEKLDSLVIKSDIKISRTINSEADRLSSVFGVTKLPTSARKSMKRVFKSKSTDGDSSEEDIRIVSSCKGVPLSGAKRTFNNRERINPSGGNISNTSGDEIISNNIQHNEISIAREEIIGDDEWNIQNINKSNIANLLNGGLQSSVDEALQNSVSEPSNLTEREAEILRLKKKLGCLFSAVQWQHWKHAQEKAELRHNMNLIIMEMRASLEADKKQAMETLTQTLEREKQRCIEEVKKKQWCAFCHQESRYACCWNTSYCTIACQKRHFPEHRNICTQLKKLSPAEAPDNKTKAPTPLNDGKENKKVLVLNVLSPSDTAKSAPAVINQKETVQQVSISKIMPSKTPIHLVSSCASPSPSTVQFVLAPIKADNSLVPIQPKPIAPKPDNSDPSRLKKNSVKQENNSLSLLKKNPENILSPQINTEKAKETNLEDIYFPSPPRISFEGLDTAVPDDNIQFIDMKDTTESYSSDAEQTASNKIEDSSGEEDIIVSDGDDTDHELVNIGRGVEILAKYLNKCLIYGKNAKRLTRCLIDVIFPDVKLLGTCSAFGNKSNVTKLTRAALPTRKVEAIIDFVLKRFPDSSRSEIVLAINMKCKEARDILGKSGDGNIKKTLFRRLLAKEQQKRETGQATALNTDNSTNAPTTVTLVKKNLNLVCVQNSSVSESSTSDKSKITNKTTTGPNIFRCSPQLLIRPKIAVPSVGPRLLVGPTTKLVRDTTKPLLSPSQPLNNGTKYNGKILLPLEVKKTPTTATSESINSQSKPLIQRPYIILGSAPSTSSQPGSTATSQPGAAKVSQLEISTASPPDALTASQLEQSESSATKMKSDDPEKIAALRTKRAEYMRNYRRAQREKQTDEEVSQHRASEAQRLRKYRQTQNV
ncbi:protein kinase C-binding protein 1 [Trichonephila inaurata madagascariensis]|uniref:Protein kinase C-binding protein 1 n=1 Tax=Trichonephila inaurata madagascariensis TaxID=2747483 RepID=A0A8X6XFD4_9ARAC|nr:protein kinase C-binding protein 1 [Trichonephila inaurata madagascariensis]